MSGPYRGNEMKTPRWLRRLVRLAAPPGRSDEVEGDLEEEHRRRLARHSAARALHELGVRLALGAGRGRIVTETLRRVGGLVAAGGLTGVLLGHLLATARHSLVLREDG